MQRRNCARQVTNKMRAAMLQGSICTELISRLSEHGTQLARAVGYAAEVDCLIAMAVAAHDYNWTRPVLTRDNVLDIQQGAGLANPLSIVFNTLFHIWRRMT